jgi:hypothetical protein
VGYPNAHSTSCWVTADSRDVSSVYHGPCSDGSNSESQWYPSVCITLGQGRSISCRTHLTTNLRSVLFVYTTMHCSLKAYCAILVRCSNFRHQTSPSVSPRESTQRRKVKLWAINVREFCLSADLHVTFRDLLRAVKLRHGTNDFTSPPKKGVVRTFLR